MSESELLRTLSGIEETVLFYPSTGRRPRARRILTEIDPIQRQLYELLGLEALSPRP
jgi:hypothetical protein